MWAIIEMMGHVSIAGKIVGEIGGVGGLTRVDVPGTEGDMETHFVSAASVYHITVVTEEVARAYAAENKTPRPWRGELVSREEHEKIADRLWSRIAMLQAELRFCEPEEEAVATAAAAGDDFPF